MKSIANYLPRCKRLNRATLAIMIAPLLVLNFAMAVRVAHSSEAKDCQSLLIDHAIFTHGSAFCDSDWLDRKASLWMLDSVRLCHPNKKFFTTWFNRGMKDFDDKVKELGAVSACAKLDAAMTTIEKAIDDGSAPK